MFALPASMVSLLLVLAPAADGWLGVYLAAEGGRVTVAEVVPGSPAAKAGLQVGDQLLAVGDQAVATPEEFVAAIRAASPGDRVRIKTRRQDQESIVVVKLGTRPDAAGVPPAVPTAPSNGQPPRPAGEGVAPPPPSRPAAGKVAPAPAGHAGHGKAYLGLSVLETADGVRIEQVVAEGPAAAAGVQAGEFVATVAEQPIRSLADLDRVLSKLESGTHLALGLRSKDGVRSVLVVPGVRDEPRSAVATPPVTAPVVPVAPLRPATAVAPAGLATDGSPAGLERELAALREELKQLRRQIEELKKGGGRE